LAIEKVIGKRRCKETKETSHRRILVASRQDNHAATIVFFSAKGGVEAGKNLAGTLSRWHVSS
jgi:hypothetical protein